MKFHITVWQRPGSSLWQAECNDYRVAAATQVLAVSRLMHHMEHTEMKYRPAVAKDFAAILDIDQSFPDAFTPEAIKDGPEEDERWFVLEGYGKVLGYIFLRLHHDHTEITNFAVHRDWQHAGWGRRIFDYGLKRAKIENADAGFVRLHVNENNARAIRFYSQAGFQKLQTKPKFYGTASAHLMGRMI